MISYEEFLAETERDEFEKVGHKIERWRRWYSAKITRTNSRTLFYINDSLKNLTAILYFIYFILAIKRLIGEKEIIFALGLTLPSSMEAKVKRVCETIPLRILAGTVWTTRSFIQTMSFKSLRKKGNNRSSKLYFNSQSGQQKDAKRTWQEKNGKRIIPLND